MATPNDPNHPGPAPEVTADYTPSPTGTQDHLETPAESAEQTGAWDRSRGGAPGAGLPLVPGYSVSREVARGGMAVVYAAHDSVFDREIAVKVMHPGQDAGRFLVESRITARLPHPGIPPVYALGELPDGRPFLAMKLIRGRTLATALRQIDRRADLPRLLGIFEQICQTAGFAHAQGVIHRDLKPANIMVGDFGEVQVMDWGLAKATADAAQADAARSDSAAPGDGALESTVAGQIKGTPSYMAPEQARGERVDARADVFALGGILAMMLTGKPPFLGDTAIDTVRRASRAELHDIVALLDGCGADADLVALAKRCLAAEAQNRFANGEEVATAIAAYRAGVEERLRQAERDRAVSAAEAREQRKRRKVQLALAAAVLLLVVGGGVFAWWQERQTADRSATEARLEGERDTEERIRLQQAGQGVQSNLAFAADLRAQVKFDAAAAALKQAETLARSGAPELLARVEQATKDLTLVVRLDDIRYRKWVYVYKPGGIAEPNTQIASPEYHKAFLDLGLDLKTMDPEEAARRIKASAVKDELVAAVDDWARYEPDREVRNRLMEIARRADPGAWLDRLRDPGVWEDRKAIEKLAAEAKPAETSPTALTTLAGLLSRVKLDASGLFATARAEHPTNFDLAIACAMWHVYDGDGKELGALEAGCALRPDSATAWGALGINLAKSKEVGAVAALRKAAQLDATFAPHHYNLGSVLLETGDLDGAIAVYKQAIKLEPAVATGHINLGRAVYFKGDVAGSMTHYREAIRLLERRLRGDGTGPSLFDEGMPDSVMAIAQNNLGTSLFDLDKLEDAAAAFRTALKHDPKHALAHYNLGNVLSRKNDFDGAIAKYREAIKLDPNYDAAHFNLGNELNRQNDLAGAIKEYREAIRLNPKLLPAHGNLADTLLAKGDAAGAIAVAREAIKLNPGPVRDRVALGKLHYNLGIALKVQGDLAGALAAYKDAIDLNPKHAEAHVNLGNILGPKGDVEGAIAAYREAIKHDPKLVNARFNLGIALSVKGDLDEAIKELQVGVKLAPADPLGHKLLAAALLKKGDKAGAEAALKEFARLTKPPPDMKTTPLEARPDDISGKLTADDPLDTFAQTRKSHCKVHERSLDADTIYLIRLTGSFDTFLRLEDSEKKPLLYNDDLWPPGDLNSSLIFRPEKKGTYRLVVTSFAPAAGAYTLQVREVEPAEKPTDIKTELTRSDKNVNGRFAKLHKIELTAGRPYTIELASDAFDTVVVLVDAAGRPLAENDDISPDNTRLSRLDFTPPSSGVYVIVATSATPDATGSYTLRVQGYRERSKAK